MLYRKYKKYIQQKQDNESNTNDIMNKLFTKQEIDEIENEVQEIVLNHRGGA